MHLSTFENFGDVQSYGSQYRYIAGAWGTNI